MISRNPLKLRFLKRYLFLIFKTDRHSVGDKLKEKTVADYDEMKREFSQDVVVTVNLLTVNMCMVVMVGAV